MKDIRKRIANCMRRDRDNLNREYKRSNFIAHVALQKKIDAALTRKLSKIEDIPAIEFPEILPVSGKRDEIAAAIQNNQVVIICSYFYTGCISTIFNSFRSGRCDRTSDSPKFKTPFPYLIQWMNHKNMN